MRTGLAIAVGLILAALAPAVPAEAAAPRCNGVPATKWLTEPGPLLGTDGPDVLVGSSGKDTIDGKGGDDLICGRNGDDLIFGGLDDDTMFGERDNDEFIDETGVNLADGGSGSDAFLVSGTARGEAGNDEVEAIETEPGSSQDAFASGGSGSDDVAVTGGVADGGSGDDIVRGFGNGDHLFGGSGSDLVLSFGPNQRLDCGSAFDLYNPGPVSIVLPNCEGEAD